MTKKCVTMTLTLVQPVWSRLSWAPEVSHVQEWEAQKHISSNSWQVGLLCELDVKFKDKTLFLAGFLKQFGVREQRCLIA